MCGREGLMTNFAELCRPGTNTKRSKIDFAITYDALNYDPALVADKIGDFAIK